MASLGNMFEFDIKDTDVVIIPEQHLYHKPIITIPEMLEDNSNIMTDILTTLSKLVNPTVIFIGDIVHRGIQNTEDSYFIQDFFRSVFYFTGGKVFSVVGNHELSYRKNNPFWGVAQVESDYINNIVKHKYQVTQPLIAVLDDMVIGDMQYSFGHYGRTYGMGYFTPNDVKYVTLLSHNSLLTPEIVSYMSDKGVDLKEEYIKTINLRESGSIPKTTLLRYIYVGHMHKAHGVFDVEEDINGLKLEFTLHYLASLGRTNHTEYNDDIERKLPIHVIRDGRFIEEKFHIITLPSRSESVDERVVLENKESYDRQKQNRELRKIESTNIDLIGEVVNYIKDDATLMDLFNRAKSNELEPDILQLLNSYL